MEGGVPYDIPASGSSGADNRSVLRNVRPKRVRCYILCGELWTRPFVHMEPDSNVGLMVAPVLGEEIRSRTREQLENVGLSLVAQDDSQPAPVLVRLRCSNSVGATPLTLAIELYDKQSQTMIWRGEAKPVLNQGDMRASLLIVDRTITKMFEHFPYHLNGWISATRR